MRLIAVTASDDGSIFERITRDINLKGDASPEKENRENLRVHPPRKRRGRMGCFPSVAKIQRILAISVRVAAWLISIIVR